jgi:hypothetical protein
LPAPKPLAIWNALILAWVSGLFGRNRSASEQSLREGISAFLVKAPLEYHWTNV